MKMSRFLIIGALSGYIATQGDIITKDILNFPIFSLLFVMGLIGLWIREYVEYKKKKYPT